MQFIVPLFLLCGASLGAQTICHFQPLLNGSPVQLAGADAGAVALAREQGEEDTPAVNVDVLRYYLSGFELRREGRVVYRQPDSYHLLDAADAESLYVSLEEPAGLEYDELRFLLGVDSTRAAGGVSGGALDPTNGMYWTWRSGYVNFKLEGTSPACPARNHRFQFHVGGFRGANNTAREVLLPATPGRSLTITLDLDEVFATLNLAEAYRVMLPGEGANRLADVLQRSFRTSAFR